MQLERALMHLSQGIRFFEVRLLKTTKVSFLELSLLQYVILTGEVRMKDISSSFFIKLSTLTSTIDKLERMQLVQRKHSAEDRRVILLQSTSKGMKIYRLYQLEIRQLLSSLADNLEDKTLTQLPDALGLALKQASGS